MFAPIVYHLLYVCHIQTMSQYPEGGPGDNGQRRCIQKQQLDKVTVSMFPIIKVMNGGIICGNVLEGVSGN